MFYLKAQKTKNLGVVLHLYEKAENIHDNDQWIDSYAEEDKEKALNDLINCTIKFG